MTKIDAIQYLVENSVYNEEWSGAGMWQAVVKVMESNDTEITKEFLDILLTKAENF